MKVKLLILSLSLIALLFQIRPVSAEKPVENQSAPEIEIQSKKLDRRSETLAKYLAKFNSPLQYHARDFIDAAEVYNLDWKLLPSIAGVESTFGKQIPGGFNAWGWGVYGNQAIYFDSWTDGIFTIAKGLRENYLDRGLTDPYAINRIYAASPHWGSRVSWFMQDMETFAGQFEADRNETAQVGIAPKIAAVSGQQALR